MKLFITAVSVLYLFTTTTDTLTVRDSQVKKIEIKAKQIKAQPGKHSIDDVYSLLFKSIDLNKLVAAKADSTTRALNEVKQDNKGMLTLLTEMQKSGNRDSEKMYIVERYIDSLPLAFAATVFIFILSIFIKRSHQIALQ